jgi:hypothetical protein
MPPPRVFGLPYELKLASKFDRPIHPNTRGQPTLPLGQPENTLGSRARRAERCRSATPIRPSDLAAKLCFQLGQVMG